MVKKIKDKNYLVCFDYVDGQMKEYVAARNRSHIKQILQKKYGLSVKVRVVYSGEDR